MTTHFTLYKNIGSLQLYKNINTNTFKCIPQYDHNNNDYYDNGYETFNHIFFSKLIDVIGNNDKYNYGQPFFAQSVCHLDEYIDSHSFTIHDAHSLLTDINQQFLTLFEYGYSISYLDLEDILVIDGTYFFANFDKFYKIESSSKSIIVTHFYDHDNILLPYELHDNTYLPFYCHHFAWFYNLACIILYCIHPKQMMDIQALNKGENENKHVFHDHILTILAQYHGTKLYYTLSFCLSIDPSKRQFILF
jgi:hypothetical protein